MVSLIHGEQEPAWPFEARFLTRLISLSWRLLFLFSLSLFQGVFAFLASASVAPLSTTVTVALYSSVAPE